MLRGPLLSSVFIQVLILSSSYLISQVQSAKSGEIKLCAAYQSEQQPVVNATVVCYDEESFFDDQLVNGTTNEKGCVLLNYTFDGGFWDSNPDIYCKVLAKIGLYEKTSTEVRDDWKNFTADFGTIFVTEAPTRSPVTEEEGDCSEISEVDMIDVLTSFWNIILSIAVSLVLTIPAVSIYCRRTEQRPEKTYRYSCIIKFVACFFSVSVLVGGVNKYINEKEECDGEYMTISISFFSAIITEGIEFIIDFGRLVLCFGDPGTLDFYQNARWNSKVSSSTIGCLAVGLSSIPIALLMFIMWLLVLLTQVIDSDLTDFTEEQGDDFNYNRHVWLQSSFGFLTVSCSFIGAYHLLRMICPCRENSGEDKGVGFHWAQFKVIAVDVPSLIITGVLEPSGLFFFWTAEFLNDGFPLLMGYIVEKYFEEEEEEDDGDEGDDLEDNKEGFNQDLDKEHYQIVLVPLKENFTIDKNFPESFGGRLDESSWAEFCDEIDLTFESASLTERVKADECCKLVCIGLGLAAAMFYWVSVYKNNFVVDEEYNEQYPEQSYTQAVEPSFYFTVLIICWVIGGFLFTKACFGRDFGAEAELIDSLDVVCSEFSKKFNLQCSLKTERKKWYWWCRGGLSCATGIDSIQGIEFVHRTEDNLSDYIDNPKPSAPVAEYVAEAVVVKMPSSKSL
mmetsp:Transcript_1969/g.2853  ORF Transcript_1969/g.2853 Transcript_1969/m.2853 type:complete len:675 (+) Transcript_1969:79-2103(+)